MKSNVDRGAFLQEMGISQDDILNPDEVSFGESQSSKAKLFFQTAADNSYRAKYKGADIQRTDASMHSRDTSPRADEAASMASSAMLRNLGQVRSDAEELKKAGNNAFERGHFAEAIRLYTDAIKQHMESAVSVPPFPLKTPLGERNPYNNPAGLKIKSMSSSNTTNGSTIFLATLYSNRSAAFMQAAHDTRVSKTPQAAYESALGDGEQAVALRPDWFKAYSRQGDAHFKLCQYYQAAEAYQMALYLEPGNLLLANSLKESQERAKSTAMEKIKIKREVGKKQGGAAHLQDGKASQNTEEKKCTECPITSTPKPQSDASKTMKQDTQKMQNTDNFKSQHNTSDYSPRSNNTVTPQGLYTSEEYRQRQLEEFRRKREARLKGSFTDDAFSDKTINSTRATTDGLTESMSMTSPDMLRLKCQLTSSCGIGESSRTFSTKKNTHMSENPNCGSTILDRGPSKRVGNQTIPYEFSSEAAAAYQQDLLKKFRERNSKKK